MTPHVTPSKSLKILQMTEKVVVHFLRELGLLPGLRRLRGFVDRLEWGGTVTVQMTLFGIREISKRGVLAFTTSYVSILVRTLCFCPAMSSVPHKQLRAGACGSQEEKESRISGM